MDRRALLKTGLIAGAASAALTACGANDDGELSFKARRKLLSQFSVNLEMWWTDLPFEERFVKAAEAGFEAVEFWFIDSWNRNAVTLKKLSKDAGIQVSQIVGASKNLGAPYGRQKFLDSMKSAIEEAQILDTSIVTITGHEVIANQSDELSIENYRNNIEAAAPLFEDAKIYAAIEPFNPYDHPGHFINGHSDALNIVRVIGSDYVKINWDLFHMQRAEGNVIENLRGGVDQICYMQLADSPSRHQPSTGEMDYVNIIRAAREGGYDGPIGLECVPKYQDNARAVNDVIALAQKLEAATV